MSSNIKPNKNRHRSEFLHIRSLLGMNVQDQVDFSYADIKRYFRVLLWDRDHICKWDKCPYPDRIIETFEESSLDHILPRSEGGRTRLSNLQLMHQDCNRKRGTTPIPMSRSQYFKALRPTRSMIGTVTKSMKKRGLV